MSFSADVKTEILKTFPRNNCCCNSLADGLLIGASVKENDEVEVSYLDTDIALLACEYIKRRYSVVPEVYSKKVAARERGFVTFTSRKAAKAIGGGWENIYSPKCRGCTQAFLRGVFVATGSVNDPSSAFRLEFLIKDPDIAEKVAGLLSLEGLEPRVTRRSGGVGLYFKTAALIQDVLQVLGASKAVFGIVNAELEHETRNYENRATNCITRNISRAVNASNRQIEAIKYLRENGKLAKLPEELILTAKLREEYPEVTLLELARLHNPEITKSGLSHRLEKIMSFYDSEKDSDR